MDISLDTYKTYYYVCQFKNLTKAAELLYVTQPAITKQIKKLEGNLGKALILRTTKGIQLTCDGLMLYNEIKNPIESIIKTEDLFKSKIDNYDTSIKINAGQHTTKNIILPAMIKFSKKHPKINFEINTFPANISIQKLRRYEMDLVFCRLDELTEQYSDIITKKICDLHYILMVSGNIQKKYPNEITISDLSKFHTIAKAEKSVYRSYIDNIFEKNGKKFTPTYELSNYMLVDEYIKSGLGIGIGIQEYAEKDIEKGNLVQIQTKEELPKSTIIAVMKKNCANYSVIKEFLKDISF